MYCKNTRSQFPIITKIVRVCCYDSCVNCTSNRQLYLSTIKNITTDHHHQHSMSSMTTTPTTSSYTGRAITNLVSPTPSDIEISQSVQPIDINQLARQIGILDDELIPYGKTK